MNPVIHIAVSCAVGLAVSRLFKSIPAFFITFVGGALVDIDHFLDYFLNHSYTLDLRKMYRVLSQVQIDKVYLIFHSYELSFLLWVIASISNSNPSWVALATGYTVHMLLDQAVNPVTIPGYFLIYRICKKFEKKHIIRRV